MLFGEKGLTIQQMYGIIAAGNTQKGAEHMKKQYEAAKAQLLAVDARDVLATSGEDIPKVSNPSRTEWDKKIGKAL